MRTKRDRSTLPRKRLVRAITDPPDRRRSEAGSRRATDTCKPPSPSPTGWRLSQSCETTQCLGWSTSFSAPDLDDQGVQQLQPGREGDINHRVEVQTATRFFRDYLGLDILAPLTARVWLTLPSQKLGTVTAGELFHDAVGLEEVRGRLAWYPHDIWLYQLAAGWSRIGQEEHLMGRAGQVGDDLGSRLIAGRLVRDLMRLCFLMERQYAPYAKWFGTAFGQLKAAPGLQPLLSRALAAASWAERDRSLGEAYAAVARLHNSLRLTDPLPANPSPFHGRPFTVISGDRIAEALRERIADPEVRALAFPIGGVDQWSDSTALLEPAALRPRLEALYVSVESAHTPGERWQGSREPEPTD
jgi:hypothetical protein